VRLRRILLQSAHAASSLRLGLRRSGRFVAYPKVTRSLDEPRKAAIPASVPRVFKAPRRERRKIAQGKNPGNPPDLQIRKRVRGEAARESNRGKPNPNQPRCATKGWPDTIGFSGTEPSKNGAREA
jgi:hypothetical protein